MSAEERLSAEERSDLLREVGAGLTEGADLLKDFWEAFRSSDAEWAAAKPELEQRLRRFQGAPALGPGKRDENANAKTGRDGEARV